MRALFQKMTARRIAGLTLPFMLAAGGSALAGPALDARLAEDDVKQTTLWWPTAARENPRSVCIVPGDPVDTPTPATENLQKILTLFEETEFGRQLVKTASDHKTLFCTYDNPMERGFYDTGLNMMMVHDGMEFGQQALITAHELRHHVQYRMGFERSLKFSRDEYVRFTYVMEADAQALATLLAWQTRAAGDARVWDGLMSIENYRDTGTAFESAMIGKDPHDETAQRHATAAAAIAWRDNQWLSAMYRAQSLDMYFDELDKTKKFRVYTNKPDEMYAPLCAAPGDFYDCLSTLPKVEGLGHGLMPHDLKKPAP
ncbi:DUF6782 family putative metallopeptidase [Micavibrio aeruginosavorus]|uniref:DUF6782 family putative metallopeptidase n=1 Tax=Micavibrio aeruginosavorus TaxID=349221 RepID=UPI003F4A9E35